MQTNQFQYLKFVRFRDLDNWSAQYVINNRFSFNHKYELSKIGSFLRRNKTKIEVKDNTCYKRVTIKTNNGGCCLRDTEIGRRIGTKQQFLISRGQFIVSKIDARNGAFGVVPADCDNAIITGNFWTFDIDKSVIDSTYLALLTTTTQFVVFADKASNGTTNRHYLQESLFLDVKIPLPSLSEQQALVEAYNAKIKTAEEKERRAEQLNNEIEDYLLDELGIKLKGTYSQNLPESSVCAEPQVEYCINPASSAMMKDTYHWGDEIKKEYRWLKFVRFKDVDRWDCYNAENKLKSIFGIVRLGELITSISTGTTPPTSIKTYFDGNVKFYTPADISDEMYLSASERYISDLAIKDNKARVFHRGDVLFVGIGSTVGKVGVVNDDIVSSNQQITGFSLKTSLVIPEYVFCFMNYNKHITTAEKTKSTLPIVNQEKIINIPIPIPPLEIQNAIVKHITELKEQIKQLKQEAKELRENALVEFEKEIFEN